jgi:predicted ATPase/DNA-binding SARP family transcriptional activator
MDVRVLGPMEVSVEGRPVALGRGKPRALLAMLALHAGVAMTSDRLIEALWGEEPPATAAKMLQVYVSQLRKGLAAAGGETEIVTRGHGYELRLAGGEVDARRFERLLADGAARDALALWRGPALADVLDEPFAAAEARRLEELRLDALELAIDGDLAAGRHREVIGELEALASEHPLREKVHAQRMLALYRAGRQAEALGAYREARRVLVEEIGIEPGPELRDLERRILAQDPAVAPPAVPATLAPSDEPRPWGNLPAEATSFVGREHELAELRDLLAGERLVTVHGAGGSGKTRVALRAAEEAARGFEHGVCLVELAPVADAALVWQTVASALGVTEEPGRGLAGSVLAALEGRSALLVLDNCEHLLEAAGEVAGAVLEGCPGVRVLATSREPLGDPAELVWPIPELASPGEDGLDLDDLLRHDAVRLFVERGERALPGYRPDARDARAAARVCHRLDGMPLAIELAAARLNVLSAEQIEERLADRMRLLTRGPRSAPARHRTLRAAVDWSFDLLSEDERSALARVSVFAGGFDIDAAEHVLADDALAQEEVLDLLTGLVAKSLVARHDEHARARYGVHATIGEYAAERLTESGDPDRVSRRHLDWYLDVMARADEELRGPDQVVWAQRLALDQDNFRRALAWGLSHGEQHKVLDLAWHLTHFWLMRGNLDESERWLGDALTRTAGAPPSIARTRALSRWGELAERKGDYAAARERYADALAMGGALGDPVRQGVALLSLGEVDLAQGRLDGARSYFEAAAAVMSEASDRERARWPIDALGRLALAAGDTGRARELFETSRAEARALGNESGVGEATLLLGQAAHHDGDHFAARGLYEESLGLLRRCGDREPEAACTIALGQLAIDTGAPDDAAGPLAEALRFAFEAGLRPVVPGCLEALAAVAVADDAATAARLLGAAATFREILGAVPFAPDHARCERTLAAAREALDEHAFAVAHGRGRAMGWREAVELALSVGGPD